MSLINIKRTLETAAGTLQNLLNDEKLWLEFLEEYPEEAQFLFDDILKAAAVLCRGSADKGQYSIKLKKKREEDEPSS